MRHICCRVKKLLARFDDIALRLQKPLRRWDFREFDHSGLIENFEEVATARQCPSPTWGMGPALHHFSIRLKTCGHIDQICAPRRSLVGNGFCRNHRRPSPTWGNCSTKLIAPSCRFEQGEIILKKTFVLTSVVSALLAFSSISQAVAERARPNLGTTTRPVVSNAAKPVLSNSARPSIARSAGPSVNVGAAKPSTGMNASSKLIGDGGGTNNIRTSSGIVAGGGMNRNGR